MIVKSFVLNNKKLKVVTLLSDKGIELFYTDTEINEAVKTLDVVSFANNKLTLKVNGKTEITCGPALEEIGTKEVTKVETPKAEEKKEEIPAEEKVTFKKTVKPTAKTTKKAGKK